MTGSVSKSETKAQSRARKLVLRSVVVGALLGIVLSVFLGNLGQRMVFDTWQRLAPREISTDNVAVVLVDDVSVAQDGAWPWSRFKVARLVENIAIANPAAIGIDIYFTENDPLSPTEFAFNYEEEELDPQTRETILALPHFDEDLAAVVGSAPTVLARFASESDGVDPAEAQLWFNSEVTGTPPAGELGQDLVVTSIAKLDDISMSHGMVNGPPDNDGVVRRVPLSVRVGEFHAPGFAMELARIAKGVETLEWEGGELLADELAIPADETARMPFRMGYFPSPSLYSASDVARGQIPADAFDGKVVIVGVGATGTFDIVATPLSSEVYGVLVQAQAVDALIEGEWLSRPPAMVAIEIVTMLLILGLILAAAMTMRPLFLWVAGGVAIVVPIASFIGFSEANLLIDPIRPLMIGGFAAIGLWICRYAIARSELVSERLKASVQQGELDAAFRIQMSMVPSEKTLARLDDRVEIGGVLRPAKSVGGDFFDAAKINEDLLLFLVADVTGKGVPAALFMALSKSLSKSHLAKAGDGLESAVGALNFDLMDEADEEMGLTMLAGTINCSTGEVAMVNAGHENPIVVHKNNSTDTLAMTGGPPFCVIDFPYAAENHHLSPGDTLVIITDGATEAANVKNELFGMEGVIGALKGSDDESAMARASHLADQVRAFEGANDPTDDLTIFTIRYVGNSD